MGTAYQLAPDAWDPLPCGGRALVRPWLAFEVPEPLVTRKRKKSRGNLATLSLADLDARTREQGGIVPLNPHDRATLSGSSKPPPGRDGQLGTRESLDASRKRGNARSASARKGVPRQPRFGGAVRVGKGVDWFGEAP